LSITTKSRIFKDEKNFNYSNVGFFLLKIEERNVEFFLLQIEERETLKKEEDKI